MIKKQSFTPRLYGLQIDFDQYFWEWPFNRVFPTPHKLPMSFTWDYMPAYCNEGVPWCEWVASPRQMPQMSRPFSLLHPRPPCLSSFLPLLILLLSFMFHFLIGIQIERETRSSSYLMNFNTITFLPFIAAPFFTLTSNVLISVVFHVLNVGFLFLPLNVLVHFKICFLFWHFNRFDFEMNLNII